VRGECERRDHRRNASRTVLPLISSHLICGVRRRYPASSVLDRHTSCRSSRMAAEYL
jgi:hypothetical protein